MLYMTESTAVQTLQLQFSGYGSNIAIVQNTLEQLGVKEPSEMDKWDEDMVKRVVSKFMEVRFPTVLVLNKIDTPEADANVLRICQKYDQNSIVLGSALAECFLRKMNKDNYIRYKYNYI